MELIIGIPIYKEIPSPLDLFSINRALEVFKYNNNTGFGENCKIVYICPDDLIIKNYPQLDAIRFDKWFFKNINTYSLLCKNYALYTILNSLCDTPSAEDNYFLLYQPDCYIPLYDIDSDIFNQRLNDYMLKGYDYVGAPIMNIPNVNAKQPMVGNGGCSLRKLSKFIEITSPTSVMHSKEVKEYIEYHPRRWFWEGCEDIYFCECVVRFIDLKLPTLYEASLFAVDDPRTLVFSGKEFPLFIHSVFRNITAYAGYIEELRNPEIKELSIKEFDKYYYGYERN